MNVLEKLRPSKSSKTDQSLPPSKEDILNTLESFTINKPMDGQENNNNSDISTQGSRIDSKLEFLDNQPTSSSASMTHSYSTEWEKLFNTKDVMKKLKEKAMDGELRSSRFRSLIWKLFLEVLPPNMAEWAEKTKQNRNKFEELKNKLIVNPRKAVDSVDITLNNPLSQDEESPWNKFFQDNELRLTIKQDVIRTFPEVEFFRGPRMNEMMIDILFCYCREHATNSYKQGMHELLAPLIFVLHCDHQAFLHACEIESVNYCCEADRSIIKEVMDPNFLEHDAYTMFCQVMETVEPWYLSRDIFYNPKTGSMRNLEMINATPFSRSQDLNPSSVIVTKLTRIQDYILKKFDLELHQHLERLEIAPQIYGIRWLRLLFGREFPMQDLLMLWDAIFSDGIGFDLVDYIFVAMLLYIKDNLLSSDYATCLTVLMKYPQVADVHYFVIKARWLREPNHQPRPPVFTHQGSIKMSSSMGESSENISSITKDNITSSHHQGQKRHNTSLGGFSSFSRKFSRPKTLSVPKSSSEPMNLQTDISPDTSNNPIGSTVSLSQVEESMFRHTPSSASLARMETSNLRSAQSSPGVHPSSIFPMTPDDASITSSPPLPGGKSRGRQKKMTKLERELQEQISHLQGEQNDQNSMCRYCASKLDVHISRLQQELSKQSFAIDDDIMVSLAGLKLVRDILNGTLKFSQNIAADDEEIQINDEYYGNQNGDTSIASPDSDILLGATSCMDDDVKMSRSHKAGLFYMSSEDASSLDSGTPSVQGSKAKGPGDQALDCTTEGDSGIQDKKSSVEKVTNVSTAGSGGQFTSKIRSLFKSEPGGQKAAPSAHTGQAAQATSWSGSAAALDSPTHQSSVRGKPGEKSGQRPGQAEREMMLFDSRPRACSNLETQSQYWPDFTDAMAAPWYSKEGHHGGRVSGSRKREEHQVRERSKSQPSTYSMVYGQDDDVNPLYRLHYHDHLDN